MLNVVNQNWLHLLLRTPYEFTDYDRLCRSDDRSFLVIFLRDRTRFMMPFRLYYACMFLFILTNCVKLYGAIRKYFQSLYNCCDLSRSSERILICCSCGTKAEIFELSWAIRRPYRFYQGHLGRKKLDSFRLVFVQMSCAQHKTNADPYSMIITSFKI